MGIIRIGTRESQLAVWQATQVKSLLARHGHEAELIFIKSEGDIDLVTPLYEIGVQGIFTRTLDAALLGNKIDVAVHSLKDVPTQLPSGLAQAAVLERGSANDLLVFRDAAIQERYRLLSPGEEFHVATSSIRRKSQWLNRYPGHILRNLRGNVNTRLKKLQDEDWDAAIFAEAGLERIGLRPATSIVLDWMLPAPAQGAVVIVCREGDNKVIEACHPLNHEETELCTRLEREFLRKLLGGCSTPISAFAQIRKDEVVFKGNILSLDGSIIIEVQQKKLITESMGLGIRAAEELLAKGGDQIVEDIRHAEP